MHLLGNVLDSGKASSRCICQGPICFNIFQQLANISIFDNRKGSCFQPKTFGTLLSPAEVYGVLSGTMPGNRSWTFLGKRISPKCLATLLGIRPQRFQRCASGRLDQRYRCFGSDTWVNLNYLLLPPGYCEIQHVLFNQNEMVSVS